MLAVCFFVAQDSAAQARHGGKGADCADRVACAPQQRDALVKRAESQEPNQASVRRSPSLHSFGIHLHDNAARHCQQAANCTEVYQLIIVRGPGRSEGTAG